MREDRRELIDQPGLTDAGLAHDDNHRGLADGCRCDVLPQQRQLLIPSLHRGGPGSTIYSWSHRNSAGRYGSTEDGQPIVHRNRPGLLHDSVSG